MAQSVGPITHLGCRVEYEAVLGIVAGDFAKMIRDLWLTADPCYPDWFTSAVAENYLMIALDRWWDDAPRQDYPTGFPVAHVAQWSSFGVPSGTGTEVHLLCRVELLGLVVGMAADADFVIRSSGTWGDGCNWDRLSVPVVSASLASVVSAWWAGGQVWASGLPIVHTPTYQSPIGSA